MSDKSIIPEGLSQKAFDFYREAMSILKKANIPFMVGGAYAFARYTGIQRHTKDFDIFVHPDDVMRVLEVFDQAGYYTKLTSPVWIGKVFQEPDYVDFIFSSGNGIVTVDQSWFDNAVDETVLGVPAKLIPAEKMLWSKGYIMERHRYDGADMAHVIHSRAEKLNWSGLLSDFGPHWRVLFSHLILFGFIYPGEREKVPTWVMQELMDRLGEELEPASEEAVGQVCQGTLLSKKSYVYDIEKAGYLDARRPPIGHLTPEELAY
jgi:hypothetical protein